MMRVPPALVTQREFNKAWGDKLAVNLELEQLGLITVNHRDGYWWVIDGQHRVYALKKRDFGSYEVECRVYENLSDEQMANVFIGLNGTLTVAPFSLFHLHCTAGHPRETAIRRIVESNGCKISRSKDQYCISAVSSLGRVKDRGEDVVLGQVVRTLKAAFDGDPGAFEGNMIEGMGMVYTRFNGLTSEKQMIDKLSAVRLGVRGLLRRAEDTKMKTGSPKVQCVAAVIVESYNKGSQDKKKRLPNWWQPDPVPEKGEQHEDHRKRHD